MTAAAAGGWAKLPSDPGSAARVHTLRPVALPPAELGRPVRMSVVNNPLSRHNRRKSRLGWVRDTLDEARVPYGEAETLDELVTLTSELVQDGTELIVINGGDGTVQGVLTGLCRELGDEPPPLVAVLPGGTTNTTARNVGYGASPREALRQLIDQARRGTLLGNAEPRPVLRVERGDGEPLFAMLFGAGAVYHGIRFAQQHVESHGLRGQLGAGVALAVFVSKLATGHGGELFPPVQARVAIDGEWQPSERLTGILTSTMDRQFLGLSPYWGEGPGPVRYSSLGSPLRHPLRAAIPVMRGRPNRFVRPEFGYKSANAECIELDLDGGFTLDGELFAPEPGTTIRLSAERSVFFLRKSAA